METIKILLGILALLLCLCGIGVVIWILLFGIPQGSMDGGTLVYLVKTCILDMLTGGRML